MNKGGCCGRLCKRPQITSSAALEWNGFGMKCRAPKSSAFFATRSDTTPERKIVFGASPCCRSSSRTVSPQISGSATSIRRRSGICFCMLRRTSRPVPTVIIEIWLYFSAILHINQRNSSLPSANNTVLRCFIEKLPLIQFRTHMYWARRLQIIFFTQPPFDPESGTVFVFCLGSHLIRLIPASVKRTARR